MPRSNEGLYRMRTLRIAFMAVSALWLCAPLRHAIEASMSAHMLLQFPLLLGLGWAASPLVPDFIRLAYARADEGSLTTVALVSSVSAIWMVPIALDEALLNSAVACAKYLSWLAAGLALGLGLARLSMVMMTFLVGNVAWMLATAGLLYLESEVSLCVNYLIDEQRVTAYGLIIYGGALLSLVVWRSTGAQRGVT